VCDVICLMSLMIRYEKCQSIERARRCSALIIYFRACGILSSIGMAWQKGRWI